MFASSCVIQRTKKFQLFRSWSFLVPFSCSMLFFGKNQFLVYVILKESVYLSIYRSIYLSTYLPIYLPTYLINQSMNQSINQSTSLSICLSFYLHNLNKYICLYLHIEHTFLAYNISYIYVCVYIYICLYIYIHIIHTHINFIARYMPGGRPMWPNGMRGWTIVLGPRGDRYWLPQLDRADAGRWPSEQCYTGWFIGIPLLDYYNPQ